MKKKLLVFAAFMAFGFLIVGCAKEDSKSGKEAGAGAITVSIKGENSENASGRAIGNPSQAQENTVKSFTVLVFNYSTGAFEKTQTFTNVLTGEITGLTTAYSKRVVVLVNLPYTLPAVENYDQLQYYLVNLDSQVPGDFSSKGLFMSGIYPTAVTLNASAPTPITVDVARVVAKVKLGTLTIDPSLPFTLDDFTLEGVSVQKARNYSYIFGDYALAGDFDYIGGVTGSVSQIVRAYLYEAYSLPAGYVKGTPLSPQIYFYVFPNNNDDDKATTLTIKGTYLGAPMYYTFRINDKVGLGTSTTDGTWIKRNMVYTLNVTLKKLGLGGDDPDVVDETAILDVTVDVADWEGELIQNVEW